MILPYLPIVFFAAAQECKVNLLVPVSAPETFVDAGTGSGAFVSEFGTNLQYKKNGEWHDISLAVSRFGVHAFNAGELVQLRPKDSASASVRVQYDCELSHFDWVSAHQNRAEELEARPPTDEDLAAVTEGQIQAQDYGLTTNALAKHFFANTLYGLDRVVEAEQAFIAAASLWKGLLRPELEASAWFTSAHLANRRGDFAASVIYAANAKVGFEATGINYFLLRIDELRCRDLHRQSRLPEHIGCLEKLIKGYRALDEYADELSLRVDKVLASHEQGGIDGLAELFQREAQLPNDPNLQVLRGRVWQISSIIARDRGLLPDALRFLEKAEQEFAKALKDGERWRVNARIEKAKLLTQLGLYDQAIAILTSTLQSIDAQAAPARVAAVIRTLGQTYREALAPHLARDWFEKAQLISQKLSIKADAQISELMANESALSSAIDQNSDTPDWQAIYTSTAALDGLPDSFSTLKANVLATSAARLGRTAQAKTHAAQSQAKAGNEPDRNLAALAQFAAAGSNQAGLEPLRARLSALAQAAERAENPLLGYLTLRSGSEVRARWAALEQDPNPAFRTALRSNPVFSLQKRTDTSAPPPLQFADAQALAAGRTTAGFLARLAETSGPPNTNSLPVDQLALWQRGLGEQDRLLVLVPGFERSLGLWVSKQSLRVLQLPGKRALESQVARVLIELQKRGGIAADDALAELGKTLFGGIGEAPPAHLLIVPDELSLQIPFSALKWPDSKDFLLRTTASSYALPALWPVQPSPDLTAGTALGPRDNPVLAPLRFLSPFAVADDGLPFTQAEAQTLRGFAAKAGIKFDEVRGAGATRAALVRSLAEPQGWLHISGHGSANTRMLGQAGLWLKDEKNAPDFVTWLDLVNAPNRSELLVLNACQLATGAQAAQQANLSFALALSASGSKNVIAGLWKVSDSASATWVPAFYQRLGLDAQQADAALRAAQLSLLNSPHFRHPFFWSSLVHFKQLDFSNHAPASP